MNDIIKGVLVQPGYVPVVVEFNEEGKLMRLPLNKLVMSKDGEILDAFVGNILVVGNDPETGAITSIPKGKLTKYFNMFLDNKIPAGGIE